MDKNMYIKLQPTVKFEKCTFEQKTVSKDDSKVQGSFIKVSNLDFNTKTTLVFDAPNNVKYVYEQLLMPIITITSNSVFRGGSANMGGVFFADSVPQLKLTVESTEIEGNKAALDGGVFYLKNLDYHQLIFEKVTFKSNVCGNYGDTIYFNSSVRSDKLASLDAIGASRRRLATVPAATLAKKRAITIQQSTFASPSGHNQIYMDKIEFIDVNKNTFSTMIDTQSLYGAGIMCVDCYTATFTGNEFKGQKALIQGGGLYLKQT